MLTLDVFEENRLARRFYERHGFREVSRYLNQQEAAMELLYCRGELFQLRVSPAGLVG